MTANELRHFFDDEYGIHAPWPAIYEVDYETYANACQSIFNYRSEVGDFFWDVVEDGEQYPNVKVISVAVGISKGIMFHGVELILKR